MRYKFLALSAVTLLATSACYFEVEYTESSRPSVDTSSDDPHDSDSAHDPPTRDYSGHGTELPELDPAAIAHTNVNDHSAVTYSGYVDKDTTYRLKGYCIGTGFNYEVVVDGEVMDSGTLTCETNMTKRNVVSGVSGKVEIHVDPPGEFTNGLVQIIPMNI